MRVKPFEAGIIKNEISGLEFLIGNEHYVIETQFITEVQHLQSLTPLPCTPAFIEGITYFRGKIMAVISLRKFLNLSENSLTNQNRIIYLSHEGLEFGVLADEIYGDITINGDLLQKEFHGISGVLKTILKGIDSDGRILLNAILLLNDESVIINDEV